MFFSGRHASPDKLQKFWFREFLFLFDLKIEQFGARKGSINSITRYFLLETSYLCEAPKLLNTLSRNWGKNTEMDKCEVGKNYDHGWDYVFLFSFFPSFIKKSFLLCKIYTPFCLFILSLFIYSKFIHWFLVYSLILSLFIDS